MPVPPKKTKPVKPNVRLPATHRRRPVEEETAGKLYLVRDKDYGGGNPELWGKDLPYADACILKETVVGRGKSRSARVADQSEPSELEYYKLPVSPRSPKFRAAPAADVILPPPATKPDPGLAAIRGAALAAVAPIAAAANARPVPAPPAPIPMPELPPELDALPDGMSEDELAAIFEGGDLPSAEDLEHAKTEVADGESPPVNWIEQAKHWPCTYPGCGAMPHIPCNDPAGPITHPERIQAAMAAGPLPIPKPEIEPINV